MTKKRNVLNLDKVGITDSDWMARANRVWIEKRCADKVSNDSTTLRPALKPAVVPSTWLHQT